MQKKQPKVHKLARNNSMHSRMSRDKNGEEKEILSDFALYDLERHMWLQVHEHRLTPKRSVGHRFMHSMTSVVLPLIDEYRWSRNLWMQKVKHIKTQLSAGFYMFGGKTKTKEVSNELWYISPNTVKNKNIVTGKVLSFYPV